MKRITINILAIVSFFWLCFSPGRALPDDALATLIGHSDSVWSVCFSPNGRLIASGSADSNVKLWDVSDREEVAELRHSDSVRSVSFSPDGDLLASGSWDETVKLWDTSSYEEVTELQHPDSIRSVSFSPDSDLLASGSWDETVRIWDVMNYEEIAKLRHSDAVYSVSFSPDGELLASGCKDDTVIIWDVATQKELAILEGHSDSVCSVSFSPDGDFVASGSHDGMIKLWNVTSYKEIAAFRHSGGLYSISFSPNGDFIASGGRDGTVKLWDVATYREAAAFIGHLDSVLSVSFSPNGSLLASGSHDGTVKLWEVTVSGQDKPIADFRATSTSGRPPLGVAFIDLSENTPTSWLWDFGDGETSVWWNPVHVYSEPGEYTVSLTVENSAGSDTETKKDYIQVVDTQPPIADFSADPRSGMPMKSITFTDLSENSPTSWLWDFGDGTTSERWSPTHSYTQPGYYTVSLRVENPAGFDLRTKRDYIHIVDTKMTLDSGTLNDIRLDPADPVITVLEGARISGELEIITHNTQESSAFFPVGATATWGDRETSYWTITEHAESGNTHHTVDINLTASIGVGTYYIVMASAAQGDVEHIMSCTHKANFSGVWHDGNDVADWDEGIIHDAIDHGFVTVPWLMANGQYEDIETSATAVKVMVTRMQPISYPCDIAVSSPGDVYLADTGNNRVLKFAPDGALLDIWGSKGSGIGQFDWPQSIAVDTLGNVYVADRNNHRIQKFSADGKFLNMWGALGAGNGQFDWPNGIAVDSSGYVYVVDTRNHRVQKFLSNGTFQNTWGTRGTGPGQFDWPQGIAADNSGNVYVTDKNSNCVQKFTSEGVFLMEWGTRGHGNGEFNGPMDVATDNSGNVYVADTSNHRIQRFTSDGIFLAALGKWGYDEGEVSSPQGVAVDELDYIHVADTGNDRVQRFTLSHTIKVTAGANGSILPSGNLGEVVVNHREDQAFAIIPDEGYHTSVVLVDGRPLIGGAETYTFENVTESHTIEAIFMMDDHIVTATANGNGSISPSGEVAVKHRGAMEFTITPDEGYHIASVVVDGEPVGIVSSYGFVNVTSDHTIEVTFTANVHIITATAGPNGIISPSGDTPVEFGSGKTFTILHGSCYRISDVLVDGASAIDKLIDGKTYTFESVKADHTIHAAFEIKKLTITPTAGDNGSISPSEPVTVNCGVRQTFSITPAEGYHLADVLVDGDSVGAVPTYTFSSVTSDHTIEAIFALNEYTIAVSSGDNGNITPAGAVPVKHGASQMFKITPDEGYRVMELLVDNAPVGAGNTSNRSIASADDHEADQTSASDEGSAEYTFTNVVSDHSISATFAPDRVKGDTNGDGKIMSNDVIVALRIAANLITPTPLQEYGADANGDGKVRSNDAIAILRMAAGLAAPAREAIAGNGRTINVALGEAHGSAGESVTVPLMVDSPDVLAGGDIRIAYDSSVLRAVRVSSDPHVLLASNIAEPGAIRIAFTSTDGLGCDIIARIEFNIIADNVSPITLNMLELYGADARPLNSRGVNTEFRSWAMPPERSALLPNFPNPFNPETWIPYQLCESSQVTIRLYSSAGQLVRTMDLGYREAGSYVTKDMAAHWDGMTDAGERVSSGVYFYSIRAGDYAATRKMTVAQ